MKSVNIFNYFPIKDDEGMDIFLKKDDELEDRKRHIHSIFIPAITDDDKSKFTNAIIKETFSISYLMSHRWPTVK